ncbi:MAG: DUF1016 N-terminal domain-containing protein [Cyanobacteria bacterium P01_D01_bin.44]
MPWKHNCVIFEKVKGSDERRWYIQQTIQNGWSRNVLTLQDEMQLSSLALIRVTFRENFQIQHE